MPTTDIPEDVRKAFADSQRYFPTPIQATQLYDKYSRYNYDLKRRETWVEVVTRATNFLKELSKNKLPAQDYVKIHKFILEMKSAPSMRLLAMAGAAARRNNISIFNCSYLPLDSIDSLVEELLIAMAGCGVGYSVEKAYIDKFPEIKMQTGEILPTFQIADSTEGWADAFRIGLTTWFNGQNIQFDYSQLRPAGTPLKTKGGRASGADPLKKLLEFSRGVILKRQGQKLRPIDVHDIACVVGEAIVSGGVRRTALIALFDFDDIEMRECKNGENLTGNEQRWMANNSAVWSEDMTQEEVLSHMFEMINGKRGEPGIFSRYNANQLAPERRKRFGYQYYGTNPCGEINLRPFGFCNLSIAIARSDDTEETLKEKVEVATIIGTIQSMATNYPGLRDIWRKNAEEERLLGVDINGQMDAPILHLTNPDLPHLLERLKKHAVETNKKYAEILGINQSAAVTCVKPSGNSGILFNCASGLHPRWSPFYIRNMRLQAQSPLRKVLADSGVPMDPENGQTEKDANTWVVHFVMKSPDGAITRKQRSAIEQCEYWLVSKKHWTEHNPSVTITYDEDEVIDLLKWVWDHREWIGGMSFLPKDEAQYSQMPNEEISKEQYDQLVAQFPEIDFSLLWRYEKTDMTNASVELACIGDACSLDDYYAQQSRLP